MAEYILTLNAGSSTVKFALFRSTHNISSNPVATIVVGMVDGLGEKLNFSLDSAYGFNKKRMKELEEKHNTDHRGAVALILDYLNEAFGDISISAIGHRIVHGGLEFTRPTELDDKTIKALAKLAPLAPLHQQHNLAGVEAAKEGFPDAVQYGCFDTSFHRTHPWVSDTFGLPLEYFEKGIRRYGFHGLSYAHIAEQLKKSHPDIAKGKVIAAHLGGGASLCAMENGLSQASTMGFSPLDGVPMGTRCGQIDPGVLLYLMDQENMDAEQISRLLYYDSGLKGLSGESSDMRTLLRSDKKEAAQAVEYFVHHIRKQIGAMTAVLGGLDALVFTGGIGENAKVIRERVCNDMQWLGLELDDDQNNINATTISTAESRVKILVIPANEELTIACQADQFI